MNSEYKIKYLNFLNDSEKKWNVNEDDCMGSRVFSDECKTVYITFKEFRSKNSIQKLAEPK